MERREAGLGLAVAGCGSLPSKWATYTHSHRIPPLWHRLRTPHGRNHAAWRAFVRLTYLLLLQTCAPNTLKHRKPRFTAVTRPEPPNRLELSYFRI